MEAGVTFYMDEDHHYDLFLARENKEKWVILRIHIGDAEQIITRLALEQEENAILEVISDKEYAMHKKELHYLGKARTKYLSFEVAGGFTGVFMGLYAVDFHNKWSN